MSKSDLVSPSCSPSRKGVTGTDSLSVSRSPDVVGKWEWNGDDFIWQQTQRSSQDQGSLGSSSDRLNSQHFEESSEVMSTTLKPSKWIKFISNQGSEPDGRTISAPIGNGSDLFEEDCRSINARIASQSSRSDNDEVKTDNHKVSWRSKRKFVSK